MRAMVLEKIKSPLVLKEIPTPSPKEHEILIKVKVCGVCRTDLHIVEGELPTPKLPLILGHQVVGIIEKIGTKVSKYKLGDRVGTLWLGGCCGSCEYCQSSRENLCDRGIYTGYLTDGGYAEYCLAHEDFLIEIPKKYDDLHAAPLLCAGVIGYRALRLAGNVQKIGFYGFGSAAHLLTQVAISLGKQVYAFTRPGDTKTQEFARGLGSKWAGGSEESPPELLDAALIFAPVGALYPQALKSIKKGGKVISAGIHMSDIPSFPYSLLWEERSISSVANVTRQDGYEFMKLAEKIDLNVKVTSFPLEKANEALAAVKSGQVDGSIVLAITG
jgi:propanol-preferring alcohol dehydrogenase